MEKAKQRGLVFNSKKCAIKQPSISFFGNRYSAEGISPDSDRVEDIRKMHHPTNKEELQKFLGLMTYMGPFIQGLSKLAQPLRDLIKDGVSFEWEADHEHSFQQLKDSLSNEAKLAYYDTSKTVNLEVDASMKGLGHVSLRTVLSYSCQKL
jgi:hypothetical protein